MVRAMRAPIAAAGSPSQKAGDRLRVRLIAGGLGSPAAPRAPPSAPRCRARRSPPRRARAGRRSPCGGTMPPTTTAIVSGALRRAAPRRAGAPATLWPAAWLETPTTCTSFSIAWRAASSGIWKSGPTSTSKPRSAKAVAITFMPRSWPSWPSFTTSMRGRRPSRLGEVVDLAPHASRTRDRPGTPRDTRPTPSARRRGSA